MRYPEFAADFGGVNVPILYARLRHTNVEKIFFCEKIAPTADKKIVFEFDHFCVRLSPSREVGQLGFADFRFER